MVKLEYYVVIGRAMTLHGDAEMGRNRVVDVYSWHSLSRRGGCYMKERRLTPLRLRCVPSPLLNENGGLN